jgi:hypothetical protein
MQQFELQRDAIALFPLVAARSPAGGPRRILANYSDQADAAARNAHRLRSLC